MIVPLSVDQFQSSLFGGFAVAPTQEFFDEDKDTNVNK